jgi:hypothetical protein
MTGEHFAAAYAHRSGTTVEDLAAWGRYPAPCACGDPICEGWLMGHQWEDAIFEDLMREGK